MQFWKRLTILLIMSVMLIAAAAPAFADYYIANEILGVQQTSVAFETTRVIYDFKEIGSLSSPKDLFIDKNDQIYLLDSNNGRIIVFDENENIDRVIQGTFGEPARPMNKPEGLFVDDIGDIFVADTQNNRVIHLSPDGRFIEEFTEPGERTYDKTYPFKPSKIAVDSFGRLCILNSNDFHGIILMDGENKFLGYIASTKIKTGLFDSLIRTFASEEQQAQLAREVPAYFSNFLMKDNFLYATSFWSDSGQIRKLTPAGGNVYPEKIYGESNSSDQFNFKPAFVDLAVDHNGIIYAAEMVTGKIYVYDSDGSNLAVFGGTGKTYGRFDLISSVAVNSKGELFVLDSVNNVIQVFCPTELMNNIIEATTLFNAGHYAEARIPWDKVAAMDSTNYLANIGFAKSAYMERNYGKAMQLYRNSLEPQGYSESFYFYRLNIFRDNFFLIVFIGIVVITGVFIFIKYLKRHADFYFDNGISFSGPSDISGYLKLVLLIFFHPIEGFAMVKRNRKSLRIWFPILLFVMFVVVRLVYVYTLHFPLSDVTMIYSGFLKQVGYIVLPLLSAIMVGHILISLSDGKQTFVEMATASMLSFSPYILLTVPLSLLSNLMCRSEAGLFGALGAGIWIWSIMLWLLSVKNMNQYTGRKLFWSVLKILFGVVCFWMICALLYIVFFQSFSLAKEIYEELITGLYN